MTDEYDEPSSLEADNPSFGEADVWIETEDMLNRDHWTNKVIVLDNHDHLLIVLLSLS